MLAMILNSSEMQCQALTSCVWPFDSEVGKRKHRCNFTLQLRQLHQITLKLRSGPCVYEVMYSVNTCDRNRVASLIQVTGMPLQSNSHYSVKSYSWGKADEERDTVKSTVIEWITKKKICFSYLNGQADKKHTVCGWICNTAVQYLYSIVWYRIE